MLSWLTAAVYCEETFGVQVDMADGFFVCPECGELIYESDWDEHPDWSVCPICEFNFEEDA